ncbi:MAG TPA: hypothetical protein VNX02_10450 [Steroidobacteraceae bacterium]|jgi:hypothetical protein|nr:hypothetical protein [Steroidobacteraceae bacterium]
MTLPQTLALATASSLLALAGCASTQPTATHPASLELAQSAETLDKDARLLATRADGEETPGFTADAHELSQRAYEFRLAAASSNANEGELHSEFARVTDSYERVRADVDRMDTAQARGDLGLVQDSYHDVASRLGTAPASSTTPGS